MLNVVLIILGFITVGTGFYEINEFFFGETQTQEIAQKTEKTWNNFAQSLTAYVKQNMNDITGSEVISCQSLINAKYYSGSCTDPVGETIEGVVAAPYGFPQSWGVIAADQPDPSILSRFDLSNPYKWHAFIYQVATLLQADNLTSAVYNSNTQTFKQPFGTVESQYSNYSFSTQPATYTSTPNVDPDGLMAFPQLHKEPGYWLWQAQLTSSSGNCGISFVNYGYSAVCPNGGVSPVPASSPWVQNYGSGTATYFSWGFEGNSSVGMFNSAIDPSGPLNYKQEFVCFPAPQSIVDGSTSFDPFPSVNNNAPTTAANPSNTDEFWTGDVDNQWAQGYEQAGEVYTVSVGSQTYSLVAYAGQVGAIYDGGAWFPRVDELALYEGSQSWMTQVAPDYFGEPQFDNTGNFFAPPVVSLDATSVGLN